MAIRADNVGGSSELFSFGLVHTGNVNRQRHFDAETAAICARTDANRCGHLGVFRILTFC